MAFRSSEEPESTATGRIDGIWQVGFCDELNIWVHIFRFNPAILLEERLMSVFILVEVLLIQQEGSIGTVLWFRVCCATKGNPRTIVLAWKLLADA